MSAPTPSPQTFSVPYNYILYMAENPSTLEILLKLHHTCKFFFAKNKIKLLLDLYYGNTQENHDDDNAEKRRYWVFSSLFIAKNIDRTKFFRFSQKKLTIQNCVLSMEEFDLLVAENTVTEFSLLDASITNATVDVVLQKLPNVTYFVYTDETELWSREGLQNLNNLQRTVKLNKCGFEISHTSDTFSSADFIYFMIQNGITGSEFSFSVTPNLYHEFANAVENWNNENQRIFRTDRFNDVLTVTLM